MEIKTLLAACCLSLGYPTHTTAHKQQTVMTPNVHPESRNQSNPQSKPVCLFTSPDTNGIPYRIPAIAATPKGRLIALADYRYCKADIGFGQIDIVGKYSDDNGKSWSSSTPVIRGNGIKGDNACGYGDAAIISDSKSGKILLMCCTGEVTYWNSKRNNPLRAARLYSEDEGLTWTAAEDITEQIYSLFDKRQNGPLQKLFIGSGKIAQSRKIKKGKYYRIYAALCTDQGNFVIYSDDLGMQWHVLGDINQSPAPKGDEPKCEELPNGDVLLSSRKHYGRYFNIYSYTNKKEAKGNWNEAVASHDCRQGIKTGANATNGEIGIYPVKRKKDNRKMYLAIQSVPAGDKREKVTIYYKPLENEADYNTPQNFASDWEGSYKVTDKGSAYSTFCLQKDGNLGFFYEEDPGEYSLIYQSLSLETITQGKYSLSL